MGMTLVEEFWHEGTRWTKYAAQPECQFALGLDLGQAHDPTAIAIVEYQSTPQDDFVINKAAGTLKQNSKESFDVRFLQRLPLNTPYTQIVGILSNILQQDPLRDGCALIIDDTGPGRPVGDLFEQAGLRPERVTITAGNEETQDRRRWHVPKQTLISTLDARLATGELRFAAALSESPAMREELQEFRRSLGASGRATYSARVGKHDDLILATALAIWWATKQSSRGTYGSGFIQIG